MIIVPPRYNIIAEFKAFIPYTNKKTVIYPDGFLCWRSCDR
jgi:hypothetical protein